MAQATAIRVTMSYGKTSTGRIYYFSQHLADGTGKDFHAVRGALGWDLYDVSSGQPYGGKKVGSHASPTAIRAALFN